MAKEIANFEVIHISDRPSTGITKIVMHALGRGIALIKCKLYVPFEDSELLTGFDPNARYKITIEKM